jgi:hypothetical protein
LHKKRQHILTTDIPRSGQKAGTMRIQDGPIQSIPVRIPVSTRSLAVRMAQQQGVSLNYFITRALRERISRLSVRAAGEAQMHAGPLGD